MSLFADFQPRPCGKWSWSVRDRTVDTDMLERSSEIAETLLWWAHAQLPIRNRRMTDATLFFSNACNRSKWSQWGLDINERQFEFLRQQTKKVMQILRTLLRPIVPQPEIDILEERETIDFVRAAEGYYLLEVPRGQLGAPYRPYDPSRAGGRSMTLNPIIAHALSQLSHYVQWEYAWGWDYEQCLTECFSSDHLERYRESSNADLSLFITRSKPLLYWVTTMVEIVRNSSSDGRLALLSSEPSTAAAYGPRIEEPPDRDADHESGSDYWTNLDEAEEERARQEILSLEMGFETDEPRSPGIKPEAIEVEMKEEGPAVKTEPAEED